LQLRVTAHTSNKAHYIIPQFYSYMFRLDFVLFRRT